MWVKWRLAYIYSKNAGLKSKNQEDHIHIKGAFKTRLKNYTELTVKGQPLQGEKTFSSYTFGKGPIFKKIQAIK